MLAFSRRHVVFQYLFFFGVEPRCSFPIPFSLPCFTPSGMRSTRCLLLWIWLLELSYAVNCVHIIGAASPIFPSPLFQEWFPFYAREMGDATTACQAQVLMYLNANESSGPLPGQNSTPCAVVQNCLLNSLDEEVKANMASSNVILGLTPTILSFIGPQMREVVPLLLERPVLGSLVSFGSPAISPVQLLSEFEFEVRKKRSLMVALRRRFASYLLKRGDGTIRFWIWTISVVEYVLLAGAVFNQIDNTLNLGRRVIIAWRCTFSVTGQVLMLIFIGFMGQWVAASSLMLRAHGSLPTKEPKLSPASTNADLEMGREMTRTTITGRSMSRTSARLEEFVEYLRSVARREFVPSSFRSDSIYQRPLHPPSIVSDCLYLFASATPLALYLYGTLIFSSFLFISTNDAAIVTIRYIATSLVCRIVLFFETDSMQ